jgi:hypothetical protein
VAKAVAAAARAGVPAEDIDRVLVRAAAEADDDFRHPVCAGRLYALARLRQQRRPTTESPFQAREPEE